MSPIWVGWSGYNVDREADNCDHEDDGTAEPSLGALNRVCQFHSAVGSRSDREEDAGDMAQVPAYGD
ncbi:hypothetical protein RFM99_28920 [Mesorhizobium sp. VK4C]|uniref:hypothetical protein n=1 Tax=Mesorhizobium captivum TaxID=3072319 RepID=UPI002A248F89|nr:hypothetical protein [Mesorhizobium sp. VK4C]MDX8502413.1 hypothetical protein [Mesorhizobium sp. VK4C]